jgi:hypothetical protein
MGALRGIVIARRDRPFQLFGFWEDDSVSVSELSTGIDMRDEGRCTVKGADTMCASIQLISEKRTSTLKKPSRFV